MSLAQDLIGDRPGRVLAVAIGVVVGIIALIWWLV